MNKFKDIWNDRVAINTKRRELILKIDTLLEKYNIDFSQLMNRLGTQTDLDYVSKYLLRNESGFKNYAEAIDYIQRFIGPDAQKFISGVSVSSIQSLVDELQKQVISIETELKPIFDDVSVVLLFSDIKSLGHQSQVLKTQMNTIYGRAPQITPYSKENHVKIIHHD